MTTVRKYRRGLSLAASMTMTLSVAQSFAADRELEEVIVTGTFIEGTPEDSAIAVESISLEDLRNLGNPSNVDLIKTLSEVGQVAGEADRSNAFPIGAATVNLRNLGSRFTTVVFNGRRMPEQYSVLTGRFNNIAWIPNAAIGRVEILKEGGAATYGADAIGGVVNYITRRNFDGLELSADYRYIEDSDGDYTANALWGTTFERGNWLVSGGYQHRSNLQMNERDWAVRHYLENDSGWDTGGSPGSYSFLTSSTSSLSIITPGGLTTATRYTGDQQMSSTGIVRDPQCAALGGFAGWSGTPSPVCYFAQHNYDKLVEESDTYTFYTELNYKLGDTLEFHSEGTFYYQELPDIGLAPSPNPAAWPLLGNGSTSRQTVGIAQTPAYFVSGRNPSVAHFLQRFENSNGTRAFTDPQIAAITTSGRVALVQNAWRPFAHGGNPLTGTHDVQVNSTRMWRVTAGLNGELPKFWGTNFDWDVTTTYTKVDDRRESTDMLIDRLQAALNGFGGADCNGIEAGQPGSTCQWFNPFSSAISGNIYTGAANPGYEPSLANDPALVRWMTVPIWMERDYTNIILDAVITGDTGLALPGGPVSMAFGGQFRWASEYVDMADLANRNVNPCATPGLPAEACGENFRTGPLVYTRPSTIFGTTRESRRRYPVAAAFTEFLLPLHETVNMQIAGRFEKFYSDVTDRDNEVVVPAVALKWQPLDWFATRISGGKTFSQVNPPKDDGPTISTSNGNPTFGNLGNANTGTQYTLANYDNVGVDPEGGSYLNFGLLFDAGGFSAHIDYFDIRVTDFARTLTAGNITQALVMPGQTPAIDNLINCSSPLFNPQRDLGGRAFVELNGTCVQGSSRLNSPIGEGGMANGRVNYWGGLGQMNAGELKTTGIDLSAGYRFSNVFGGTLRPSVDASYVLEWELEDFVVAGVKVADGYDGVGLLNQSSGRLSQSVPEWRGSFSLLYNHGRHTVNLTARYVDSIYNENESDFDTDNGQNANIGNDSRAVTQLSGTPPVASCTTPGPAGGLTSNLSNVPAGAGSGSYGRGSVLTTGPSTSTVGFCASQNTSILSGRTIDSITTVDLTYRVQLPWESDLSLTVYNLLNDDPSFYRGPTSYSSGYGSPLERNVKLGVSKRF